MNQNPNPEDRSPTSSSLEQALELPPNLKARLENFRRKVWLVKIAEGALAAMFGLALSYLAVFLLDRVWDTPATVRALILVAGASGFGFWFPTKCHRWVWEQRNLEQAARLLRLKFRRLGDHLLGIVELAKHRSGSEALIKAAFKQADERIGDRDFARAVPDPNHWRWAGAAALILILAVGAIIAVPKAGKNAGFRWLTPWKATERYTFAQVEELPKKMVVPYAEDFDVNVNLSADTDWKPDSGTARFKDQLPVTVDREEESFAFSLAGRTKKAKLKLAVGDDREEMVILPTTRPELEAISATLRLPDYLRYSHQPIVQVRDGTLSVLKGSEATFQAEAKRNLAEAQMDGRQLQVKAKTMSTEPFFVAESREHTLTWRDTLGLTAKEPLKLRINAFEDAAPNVIAKMETREQVVLVDETVQFQLKVNDDFGVREAGLMWVGSLFRPGRDAERGAKVVAAGGPELKEIETAATFNPARERVKPQTIQLVAYAQDYLPGREPAMSRPFILHILGHDQHALWITDQIGKWFRQAQEVYEREKQLHATNQELRQLSADEMDDPANRRRIEAQAQAEANNGKRLDNLTKAGKDLAEEAVRNREFDAERLELFAQSLQKLKDIAQNRMPSVADLLKDAANAPQQQNQPQPGEKSPSESQPNESEPSLAENQQQQPKPGENQQPNDQPKGPQLDTKPESGWMKPVPKDPNGGSKSGGGGLGLPSTNLAAAPGDDKPKPPSPAQQSTEEAVVEQTGLLDEFAKISEQLKELLNSLEASTFVKRLKAASREQIAVAGDLNDTLNGVFGMPDRHVAEAIRERAKTIADRETEQSEVIHTIQQDLQAYFHRKQDLNYKKILEQMRESSVVAEIREIGDAIRVNLNGRSIAAAEFWADALDRWAEELVPASRQQSGKGQSQNSDSLPPEVVLKVMQILHDEIELREETRELERAKAALPSDDYAKRANDLADTQRELRDRTYGVVKAIESLPFGARRFGKPIQLLTAVTEVMSDARNILAEPNTGPDAIAAETEAIELLLQTRRSNPNGGGGGGGGSPGGGGSGAAGGRSALSGLGPGADSGASLEDREVDQSTGRDGRNFPEEFRNGLDAYFNELERGGGS